MTQTLLSKTDPEPRTEPVRSVPSTTDGRDPMQLPEAVRSGLMGLGEAYMAGAWDADRLDDYLYELFTAPPQPLSIATRGRMLAAALLPRLIDRQAGLGAFRIGREHYDLGNDLFEAAISH